MLQETILVFPIFRRRSLVVLLVLPIAASFSTTFSTSTSAGEMMTKTTDLCRRRGADFDLVSAAAGPFALLGLFRRSFVRLEQFVGLFVTGRALAPVVENYT